MAVSKLTALLIFVGIAVLVFVLARANKIRPWSAIVLALLLAQIVVGLFYPPGTDQTMMIINLIIGLIVLVYVFNKALTDKENTVTIRA